MVHRVVDSGWDNTECGRWSYLTCATKEGKKLAVVSAYRVCKQTNHDDLASSKQQLGIMYKYKELRPYLVDPSKQTLIDLQYFVEKLKATGRAHINGRQSSGRTKTYQPQSHNIKLVTKQGFHVDGTIDRSLQSFMQNCGLINILRQMHKGVVPNTYSRLAEHV
jgi:hypothetical protein